MALPVCCTLTSTDIPSGKLCVLCTKVGLNFGCHMTPAEFYVSSDALVATLANLP